jgi:catechol 2,3-dioxygenase-like lactoylglutathione lyase family enzyme
LKLGEIVCFVPSRNLGRAKAFYGRVLGLRFVGEDQFAMVFDSGGIMIRVVNVEGVSGFKPAPFTILGWQVEDARKAVRSMRRKGVKFEKYAGMEQDEIGIWTSPSGAKVAWFKDPDGNLLSVTG